MTEEEKINTQTAQLPTEEQKDEDENSSSSDGKKDDDSSDSRTLKSSSKPPVKSAAMKTKPAIVGKIQNKGLKVSPPRMNNSPRGR